MVRVTISHFDKDMNTEKIFLMVGERESAKSGTPSDQILSMRRTKSDWVSDALVAQALTKDTILCSREAIQTLSPARKTGSAAGIII